MEQRQMEQHQMEQQREMEQRQMEQRQMEQRQMERDQGRSPTSEQTVSPAGSGTLEQYLPGGHIMNMAGHGMQGESHIPRAGGFPQRFSQAGSGNHLPNNPSQSTGAGPINMQKFAEMEQRFEQLTSEIPGGHDFFNAARGHSVSEERELSNTSCVYPQSKGGSILVSPDRQSDVSPGQNPPPMMSPAPPPPVPVPEGVDLEKVRELASTWWEFSDLARTGALPNADVSCIVRQLHYTFGVSAPSPPDLKQHMQQYTASDMITKGEFLRMYVDLLLRSPSAQLPKLDQ